MSSPRNSSTSPILSPRYQSSNSVFPHVNTLLENKEKPIRVSPRSILQPSNTLEAVSVPLSIGIDSAPSETLKRVADYLGVGLSRTITGGKTKEEDFPMVNSDSLSQTSTRRTLDDIFYLLMASNLTNS